MDWQDIARDLGCFIELIAYILIGLNKKLGWLLLIVTIFLYGSVQYSWWGLDKSVEFVYPISILVCLMAFNRWRIQQKTSKQ